MRRGTASGTRTRTCPTRVHLRESPEDHAVVGEVDAPGSRPLRQSRHRHDVAADHHDEAGTGRQSHLAHVQGVTGRGTAGWRRWRTSTGSSPRRRGGGHSRRPRSGRVVVGLGSQVTSPARTAGSRRFAPSPRGSRHRRTGELVRRRLVDQLQDTLGQALARPPPSTKCVASYACTRLLGRFDHPRDLGVGVGREAVDRDHARDAVDGTDVVQVPAMFGMPASARQSPPPRGRRGRRHRGTSAHARSPPQRQRRAADRSCGT